MFGFGKKKAEEEKRATQIMNLNVADNYFRKFMENKLAHDCHLLEGLGKIPERYVIIMKNTIKEMEKYDSMVSGENGLAGGCEWLKTSSFAKELSTPPTNMDMYKGVTKSPRFRRSASDIVLETIRNPEFALKVLDKIA